MTALEAGMLVLSPDGPRPTLYTATSRRTLVTHHGNMSEKVTLRKPGEVPEGWLVIDQAKLAQLVWDQAKEKLRELPPKHFSSPYLDRRYHEPWTITVRRSDSFFEYIRERTPEELEPHIARLREAGFQLHDCKKG